MFVQYEQPLFHEGFHFTSSLPSSFEVQLLTALAANLREGSTVQHTIINMAFIKRKKCSPQYEVPEKHGREIVIILEHALLDSHFHVH